MAAEQREQKDAGLRGVAANIVVYKRTCIHIHK